MSGGGAPVAATQARRALVAARRVVVAVVAVILVVVAWATPAWAHAELRGTEPAAGEQLERAPSSVLLRFTEDVDPVPGAIRLVRSDGREVPASVGRAAGDGSTVQLTPQASLAEGTYVVAWRVTSADSHPVRGAFTFSVGDAGEQDTAALVNRLLSQESGMAGTGAALAVGRWAAYGGLLLAAGWLAMAALGRAAVLRRGQVALAASVGAAGTVVMLAAQAAALRSSWSAVVSPAAWADVLDTRSGGWWGVRLAVAVVAAVAARAAWPVLSRRPVAAPAALALCVVAALGGHAQSGRWAAVGFVATVAHLVTAALWSAG
ncbi:MAG: copper resistance protein CopC/CopD, partial [Acidimicrobiales bacterium]|nr:copper resistance protein CopC/CopD [Acidimicrobiales bacterium]